MKKVLCLALCVLMAVSFVGCKVSVSSEVNPLDKLTSLLATDEALGLKGKYSTLADITDGSIDKDLVGTWKMADGETTYVFNEDGVAKASSTYGETEAKYTCFTANDYKIVCEEVEMESTDVDGNTTTSTVLSYSTYTIENDALFMTVVEETDDEYTDSSQSALVTMYRADESGSIEEAMSKNAVALASFDGTWASDAGEFTIADGKLTLGEDAYDISVNDKGQLVVEKDGASSAYSFNVSIRKEYDTEDKTKFTETKAIGLYFTGADENDTPNLGAVLEDWSEFQPNYYTGTFDLQQ